MNFTRCSKGRGHIPARTKGQSMTTETATAAATSAEDRAHELHQHIKATYSEEIFRLAYRYAEAEAEGESRAAQQDREWVRFIRRLAAHFPGLEPAIICVAETMSELEMGHFTQAKFGTPADPHLVGVIDE